MKKMTGKNTIIMRSMLLPPPGVGAEPPEGTGAGLGTARPAPGGGGTFCWGWSFNDPPGAGAIATYRAAGNLGATLKEAENGRRNELLGRTVGTKIGKPATRVTVFE
jgi:hypothetical protein